MTGSLARSQAGLTLIELLVAAVVLAIGLIGFVALQIQGLRVGQIAENGKIAGPLANQLVERVRLNASNADSYTTLTSSDCPPPTPATQHALDYCAVYDAISGKYRSHSALEAVSVSCLNCPNPTPQYQVTVSWGEMGHDGKSGDNSYVVGFILPNS